MPSKDVPPATSKAASAKSTRVETVGDFYDALAGPIWKTDIFVCSPPDVFCLTSAILQRTGAYIQLVKDWPIFEKKSATRRDLNRWLKNVNELGYQWWKCYNHFLQVSGHAKFGALKPPKDLTDNWKIVAANWDLRIESLIDNRDAPEHRAFWQAIFYVSAAADEACWGIGISKESGYLTRAAKDKRATFIKADFVCWTALKRLYGFRRDKKTATLCHHIKSHAGVVLPKTHTPQSGITLRSISHNLAYIRPAEVKVGFVSVPKKILPKQNQHQSNSEHSLNLLLVPWPEIVRPKDIDAVNCSRQVMSDGFGFFTYRAQRSDLEARRIQIKKLIDQAHKIVGRIDGLVMPEMALKSGEEAGIAEAMRSRIDQAFLITGTGDEGPSQRVRTRIRRSAWHRPLANGTITVRASPAPTHPPASAAWLANFAWNFPAPATT